MENKTKPEWRFDIIISVCAMLVSVATFGIYLYQTKIIREQAHASVYPHLEIERRYGSQKDPHFILVAKNVGIGPAFLKSMEIKYRDSVYYSKNYDGNLPIVFLREILPSDDKFPFLGVGGTIPMVIPAGEKEMFLILNSKKYEDMKLLVGIFDEAKIKICYSSVYKDYWTVEKWKQPEECKNCENENLFKPLKK
jgi:hypothetical protein